MNLETILGILWLIMGRFFTCRPYSYGSGKFYGNSVCWGDKFGKYDKESIKKMVGICGLERGFAA